MCTDLDEQSWFDEVVERRRRFCGIAGLRSPRRVAPTYHVSWVRGSTGCGISLWLCTFARARRWAETAARGCSC